MTDEQIKQNAEAWVKPLIGAEDGGYSENSVSIALMKNAFIEGAHSRDEEIKRLENKLALFNDDLDKALYRKEKFRQKNKRAQQHIKYLKAKLTEMARNPWISVDDGLPEKIKNKGVSKNVFVTWPDGTRGEAYYNYEEYKAPRWEIKGAGIMKPAYWMPIPQIKKGE